MTQSAASPAAFLPGNDSFTGPVTVLGVRDDAAETDAIGPRFDGVDAIEIETVATPTTAPAHLDAVDCVVCDGDLPVEELLELLAAVRRREPTLPFVLVADDPDPDVVDALFQRPWADCLHPESDPAGADALGRRIHELVGHRRTAALASRALAAVDQSSDAIAIVAPDGTVEFVNPLFTRKLDTTAEALVGRNWRAFYPDSEVDRLESDAFPSLADGWRWVGDCEMRRADGSTFVAQTRIDALDDDSLVFTVSDRPAAED